MALKISWFKHPIDKNSIVGICNKLPDSFCQFKIMRMTNGTFWILLPSFSTDNFEKRIIVRDPHVARGLCEDFLNFNLATIIKYQISEMKRRTMKGDKPVSYYETILNEITKPDTPYSKLYRAS